MRKFKLITTVLVLFGCGISHAQYGAITGFCEKGATPATTSGLNSTNTLQGVVAGGPAGCLVQVYLTGTVTPATIYPNSSGGTLVNPFRASLSGQWLFYAAYGVAYDVVMSGGIAPNSFSSPVTLTGLSAGVTTGTVGINQLTGDVLAGPGVGSQASTVVGVNGSLVPASTAYLATNSNKQIVAAATPAPATGSTAYVQISPGAGVNQSLIQQSGTTFSVTNSGNAPAFAATNSNAMSATMNLINSATVSPNTGEPVLAMIAPNIGVTGEAFDYIGTSGTQYNGFARAFLNQGGLNASTNCGEIFILSSSAIPATGIQIDPAGGIALGRSVLTTCPTDANLHFADGSIQNTAYTLGGTLSSGNVSLGAGAGTGASLTGVVGLDGTHYVELTTGGSPTASANIYTLTFTASRGHASQCILSASDLAFYTSFAQVPNVSSPSATAYSFTSTATPLAASTSYIFAVSCP